MRREWERRSKYEASAARINVCILLICTPAANYHKAGATLLKREILLFALLGHAAAYSLTSN